MVDFCVVGVPDEYSGEVAMAFVVLRDGILDPGDSSEDRLRKENEIRQGLYDVRHFPNVFLLI